MEETPQVVVTRMLAQINEALAPLQPFFAALAFLCHLDDLMSRPQLPPASAT